MTSRHKARERSRDRGAETRNSNTSLTHPRPEDPRYVPGLSDEPVYRSPLFPRPPDLGTSPPDRHHELRSGSLRASSRLSPVASAFTQVPLNSHKACADFIKKNPEVQKEQGFSKTYLAEAIDAFTQGDETSRAFAFSCMEKCLLLQKNRERAERASAKGPSFLTDLIEKNKAAIADFQKAFVELREYCERAAEERRPPDQKATTRERTTEYRQSEVPIRTAGRRHEAAPPREVREGAPHTGGSRQHSTTITSPQAQTSGVTRRHGGTAQGPGTILSGISSINIDDLKSLPPRDWNDYFKHGRVFATFNHTQDTTRPSSANIIARLRRYVVVGRGDGYCWALPIYTYGGQGLSKPGLTRNNRDAHAIIHTRGNEPHWLEGEPRSGKRSIEVLPFDNSSIGNLHPASRLNFEKVTTVEMNQRIIKIGEVSPKTMPYLQEYWLQQLKAKEAEYRR